MAKKVLILANCQGQPLASLIENYLEGYTAEFHSNNARTGGFQSADHIADQMKKFDVLIYQPLREEHGPISDASIQNAYPLKDKIRFAYLFNSGISSLGYAPFSPKNPYGQVLGEESIIKMIDAGKNQVQIANAYAEGYLSSTLPDRFARDLANMAQREHNTEIRLANFIQENYKKTYLFVSHNHQSSFVSFEIFEQIVANVAPAQLGVIRRHRDAITASIRMMPYTGHPISPHDATALGYSFGYHSDWREKQKHLIDLVYRHHARGETVTRDVYKSTIVFPDTAQKVD